MLFADKQLIKIDIQLEMKKTFHFCDLDRSDCKAEKQHKYNHKKYCNPFEKNQSISITRQKYTWRKFSI